LLVKECIFRIKAIAESGKRKKQKALAAPPDGGTD
jgi:hypothetical protein